MKLAFIRMIAFYFRHSQRVVVGAITVGLIAGVISAGLMALVSIKIAAPEATPDGFVWLFVVMALLDLGATLTSGLLSNILSQRISFDLRMRLCRQVMAAPLRRLEETGTHRIGAVLNQDITAITDAFLQVPQICVHLAVVGGCLAYLGWLSPRTLGVLVLILVAAVLSVKIPEGRGKRFLRRAREEWDALTGHLHALTEGAKELKLHRRRRDTFLARVVEPTAQSLRDNSISFGKFFAVLNGWTQVLYFVIIGLILFLMPQLGGGYDRRVLAGYAITVLFMRGHIVVLMSIVPIFNRANVSLRKVQELGISLAASATEDEAPADGGEGGWQRLELSDVFHSYRRDSEDGTFVLGPVDLTLRPGEIVFVVGGNGSGKTTLAKVLTGLYVPEAGEIRLDGEAVTDKNRDRYRQHFSVIFSDFYLFEQLLGLEEVDLDERARGYISELQLDHKVTVKDGKLSTINLSLGQRKRLALLTAYLEDRPIYVFDEWASGQDPVFKDVFYNRILPAMKAQGKTLVVVSHDDRYFHVADRVVKLDDGRVVETPAPAAALASAEPENVATA